MPIPAEMGWSWAARRAQQSPAAAEQEAFVVQGRIRWRGRARAGTEKSSSICDRAVCEGDRLSERLALKLTAPGVSWHGLVLVGELPESSRDAEAPLSLSQALTCVCLPTCCPTKISL